MTRMRLCRSQPGRHGNRASYLNAGARGRALTAPGWAGLDNKLQTYDSFVWTLRVKFLD